MVRLYVLPRIGRQQLSALSPLMLSRLYATLLREGGRNGKPLSATTVRLVHKILHKAFADAVTWELLAANPRRGPASRSRSGR